MFIFIVTVTGYWRWLQVDLVDESLFLSSCGSVPRRSTSKQELAQAAIKVKFYKHLRNIFIAR